MTFTAEAVQSCIDSILESLGTPETPLHEEALKAFQQGDADKIRLLAATHLEDHYCRSLGYLVSAPKLLPTTAVILAEAARAAADFAKERTLHQLGQAISEAMELDKPTV